MSISLQKGQKVSLTKGNPGLSNVVVGKYEDTISFFIVNSDIDCNI